MPDLITKTYDQLPEAADAPADALIGVQQPGGPMQAIRFALILGAVADASAAPVRTVAGRMGDVTLEAVDVGLGDVDNTADIDKPVSIAAGQALSAKVDRYPATPHLPLVTGYKRFNDGWLRHFFNSATNHIRPTDGSGGPNNGLPDSTTLMSSWQAGIGIRYLYWRWRIATIKGDAADTASAAAQIAGHWDYWQTQFSASDFKTGHDIINSSDDVSIHTQQLQYIHEVTGDANALSYLIESLAFSTTKFLDVNQVAKDYGVSTPGGTPFKAGPYGMAYFYPPAVSNVQNDIQDLATASAALYGSQQPSVPAPLRAALLAYAQDTWQLVHQYCRASVGTFGPVAVPPAPNLYFLALDLDPTHPGYLKGVPFGGNSDAPVRGQSSFGPGTHFMMIALSLRLGRITGDPKYLAEARAAVTSAIAPNGFLRRGPGGVPLIANPRDPWVDHSYTPEYIVADFFEDGAAGVPDTGDDAWSLAEMIYNSAQVVTSGMVDGYGTPDWVGDEYCPLTGYYRWTDEGGAGGQGGDPNADYGGNSGGGQGTPRQIMTSSATGGVVLGGYVIEPYVQTRGSGVDGEQGVTRLPARLAAIELALSQLMPRSGGYFSDKFGLDEQFYFNRNVNPYINWAQGWFNYFDRANARYTFSGPGSDILQMGLGAVKVVDTVYFSTRQTQSFYASYGDGPYVNFGNNSYLACLDSTPCYDLVLGGKRLLRADGNATLYLGGNAIPDTDAAHSLGLPSYRMSVIYAASSTIATSDETQKLIRGPLSEAELAAAREIGSAIVIYQFTDAIAAKGADVARLHAGVGAQTVFAIFAKHGLDPHRYGVCCWDEWEADPGRPAVAAVEGKPAIVDMASIAPDNPQGTVLEAAVAPRPYQPPIPGRAAGSGYALRYDELWAFVAAAQEQRLAALEARIA